jgi:hypothetical protein
VDGPMWQRLGRHVPLHVPILRRLVRTLTEEQLLRQDDDQISHQLTEAGHLALKNRTVPRRAWKRGQFSFVERVDAGGRRLAPPHFLNIQEAAAVSWHAMEENFFDVAWLHDCLNQASDWKKAWNFPPEAMAFPAKTASLSADEVIVDRTERLLMAFLEVNKPEQEILGFGIRPEGWVLNAAEPILRLPASAAPLVAELSAPASLELWQQAWLGWCRLRGLPEADAGACSLTLEKECLCVQAPEGLHAHWQAAKSEIFHGDTWLLAGTGYVRRAARLVVKSGP